MARILHLLWFARHFVSCVLLLVGCIHTAQAFQDMPAVNYGAGTHSELGSVEGSPVNVIVSVREANGLPLPGTAEVKFNCPLAGVYLTGQLSGTAMAQFTRIPAGDCRIEASAPGFRTARDTMTIYNSLSVRNLYVYLYLHPESEIASSVPAKSLVTPALLKEMDKGMEGIQKNRPEEARKHLSKAASIAPGNPDVQYLLGMLEYQQKNMDAARTKFETAVSLYPNHERALVSLGQIQLQQGQTAAAADTLERALRLNTSAGRTNLLLAEADYQRREFTKAESYAQRAAQSGGEDGVAARVLLGKILAAQGAREEARAQFQSVLRDFPKAPAATVAREALANLDKATNVEATSAPRETGSVAGNDALISALPLNAARPWAPPDIDSTPPGVAPDVTCSEAEIVELAGKSTTRQLANFEKFLATEHIEHQELNAEGATVHLRTKDFTYLVFVQRDKDGFVFLDEKRDGGTGVDSFPTSLATVGLLELGVAVFQPGFSNALQFKCEGLGQWRGKAAWVIRFEQRQGQRSYLRLWENRKVTVEVPLKGRVWVAAGSYDVLHIESDLREPMKELELTRDHLIIDYGPVKFEQAKTELWLPWYAEMYLELHGKRYHHQHTLSNYALFAVDTNNKISAPKDVPPPEEK